MIEGSSPIIELDRAEQLTPEQCLTFCMRNYADCEQVIVLGYNPSGTLVMRGGSNTPFRRKDALWMLMEAQDWIRGVNQDDE